MDLPLPRRDAISWIDQEGNLWLMGGKQLEDAKCIDDLWKYSPGGQVWSRISGKSESNQQANWGTEKSVASGNSPGSRSGSATWTDKDGNLWLFGGTSQRYGAGKSDYNSDLWLFDSRKQLWSWRSGSNKPNSNSFFASQGEASAKASPSPREKAATWYDQESDKLWLYGGLGTDSTGTIPGGLADLWCYDIKSEKWTWISGSKILFAKRDNRKGTKEINTETSPGYHWSAAYWKDKEGNLWLYGGQNRITQQETDIDQVVWKYDLKVKKWTGWSPANSANVMSDGKGFTDITGNFLLFGGWKFNFTSLKSYPTNEIWKFTNN